MRNIITIGLFLSIVSCHAQNKNDEDLPLKKDKVKKHEKECSNYYWFENKLIDLEQIQEIVVDGLPASTFKDCSKYAHRFQNIISDSVYLDGKLYVVENNKKKKLYNLLIYKNDSLEKTIKLPVENPLPEVHEYYIYMFPYKKNLIMFLEDMYTTHYTICKYNAKGEELKRAKMEHTYITHPEPKTNYMHRYLYYHSLTASQMIFTSHMAFADKFATRILNLDEFTVKNYDKMAHGIILDEDDKELVGFATAKKDYEADKQPVKIDITMINGKKYSFSLDYGNEACEFLLKGDLLYIGNYHPIATGSSLHCFDLKTGKMKWTADVLQMNVGHSEYWNKVTLSLYKDKLLMQGDEANGSYLQIFDAETGKRLKQFGLLEIKD